MSSIHGWSKSRILEINEYSCTRQSKILNFIPRPVNMNDKLFVMRDSVHVFKNVAAPLTNERKFYLDESIVTEHQLPSNMISIEPIKQVFSLDQKDTLKLCPRLKENVLSPSHFEKMNVSLLNHDVAL